MTDIILLGASTRAAAMSARRAGWTAWCADLFADADLQRIATVRKVPIETYPHGLLDALTDAPQAPVMYTGALENRPDLIAKIDRPLWGNSPDVLRAIRSPERWVQCLLARGLLWPAISAQPTDSGRWLLKPRKSAGGFGIHAYDGQSFDPRTHFLQEWIDGQPCSATFLGNEGGAILLGVTQQLIGTPWLHATGFHYAGSVGPLPLDGARWRELGSALAETFHLRGLFGVDAILRDGVPWPVEINPRYTASVEILERGLGFPFLRWHAEAFPASASIRARSASEVRSALALRAGIAETQPVIWSKGVLFARQTFAFPADLDDADYADIPHAGDVIEQGRPVLTLFASGTTVEACTANLREKAESLDQRLWG